MCDWGWKDLFWGDLGYAVRALMAGVIADLIGIGWAIGVVGGLTLLSGIVTAVVMRETRPPVAESHIIVSTAPPRQSQEQDV